MGLSLGSLFGTSKPITREVTAGTGGYRDAWLQHLEQTQTAGQQPLSFDDFVKQQERLKAQQQQQPQAPSLPFFR